MHVAVLGATGAVGRTMLQVLDERDLPVERLTLLASERSAGSVIRWRGREITVREAAAGIFRDVDFALFSAGATRSREWAPVAAEEGAVVIDNSSAWRMDPDVPLVVPEVNPDAIGVRPKGIIANPNCSTIQMVVALKPLDEAAGLVRVIATTFQSVSGAGEAGREALRRELRGDVATGSPFSRRIAANVIPQIGDFDDEGWTGEERKMILETRKIMSLLELPVAATCVRAPVDIGHSVQVAVETRRPLSPDAAAEVLSAAAGIIVSREPGDFPTPLETTGRDEVFVGRIRRDPYLPNVLHLWVVADNLRKGAATNAIQIAERLIGG